MAKYDYRYDLISADIDYGVRIHPQQDLTDRGYKWIKSEPCSIADCWFFRFEEELDNPPAYLQKLSNGFKFADE